MISLVILAMAIATIMPLFAVGAAAHKSGVDQAHVSWIAPRIAARLQENLEQSNPKDVKAGKWTEGGTEFTYDATFKPLVPAQSDPSTGAAFILKVEVRWRDGAGTKSEAYETILLRKLRR